MSNLEISEEEKENDFYNKRPYIHNLDINNLQTDRPLLMSSERIPDFESPKEIKSIQMSFAQDNNIRKDLQKKLAEINI